MAKTTVEECLILGVDSLKKYGYFSGFISGEIKWTSSFSGREWSVGVSVCTDSMKATLNYTTTDRSSGERVKLCCEIDLVTTPCNLGGKRYWFICPAVVGRRFCGRRVGKLYKADYNYFFCRHCNDLTYGKRNENKRMRALGRMLDSERKAESVFEGLKRKRFFYRGYPTRRYLRYRRYLRQSDLYSEDFLELELQMLQEADL